MRQRLLEEKAVAAADLEQGALARPVIVQPRQVAAIGAFEVGDLIGIGERALVVEPGEQGRVGDRVGAHQPASFALHQPIMDAVGQPARGEDRRVERLKIEVGGVKLGGIALGGADRAARVSQVNGLPHE